LKTVAARWLARTAFAGVAVGLALGCGAILGIDDVLYGPSGDGGDGSTSGDGAVDQDGNICRDPKLPTKCNNDCVDVTSNGKNCGRCGYDCGGRLDSCSGSTCLEVVLEGGLADPHGIVVDEQFAYVTLTSTSFNPNRRTGSVVRIPLDGGAPQSIATNMREPSFIVIHGDLLVWTTADGLSSSLKDGGSLSTADAGRLFGLTEGDGGVYAIGVYDAPCLLVRWTPGQPALSFEKEVHCGRMIVQDETSLYWTNFPSTVDLAPFTPGISVLPLASLSSPVTTIAGDASAPTGAWGMAQDKNHIYFSVNGEAGGLGALRRIAKDGGSETTLAEGLDTPRVVLVDDDALYVSEHIGGRVLRFGLDGGADGGLLPKSVLGTGGTPLGMALSGGFLYWVDSERGDVKRVRLR